MGENSWFQAGEKTAPQEPRGPTFGGDLTFPSFFFAPMFHAVLSLPLSEEESSKAHALTPRCCD